MSTGVEPGRRGAVAWLTGRPAAGKSTLASAAERLLLESGWRVSVLDGDQVRKGLNRDLGYSADDRTENLRRLAELARLQADAGALVIVAAISPLAAHRERARAIIGADRFVEVYICADLETCERRDPKGHYRKARAGQLPEFTGVGSPYEPPASAGLVIDTTGESASDGARRLADALRRLGDT